MTARRPLMVAAEAGLVAVTLATVLGMSRLFEGGAWLAPLVINAVAAHAVVALLRRRGLSLPISAGLMGLGAALVATWTSYWATTAVGIPTAETWSAMSADLGDAWTLYKDVVAPAPAETGFVLASSLAVWCVAYVADWAAFRLWVPFEATLPAGTLFLFTSLLGAPRGRTWAVALYAGSLLAFLLLHRMARQEGSSHWVADRSRLGHRSLLTVGAGLGAMAVVVGSVLGPAFPGARSPGVLDPRALREDDGRVTISPLVDIKSRLVEQSAIDVFTVRSPVRSYWRLTSLERFDGRIWSSSGSFGQAEEELPSSIPSDIQTEPFEQTYRISALAAIWLPSAYEPRALAIDDLEVRYDDESATLIVGNEEPDSDGLEYVVTSTSPRLRTEDLTGQAGDVPGDIRDRFVELPADFSPRVTGLAQEVTVGLTTPAEQARALQDYLRGFEYSLEAQAGHSQNALEDFLFETQVGYCEQFAGAFAAMARSIGLPARVAVGFTPGEEDPQDPGLYQVRGEYAHAWPEVFIAGAGWVAYEPTPGRGMPYAASYTGVPEAQAAPNNPGAVETAPPTSAAPTIPSGTATTVDVRDPDANVGAGEAQGEGGDDAAALVRWIVRPVARAAPIVGGVLLGYAVLCPLGLLLRRTLRRRRATTPLDKVELAWRESVEEAEAVGFRERRSDTYFERAHRLAAVVPSAEDAAFVLAGRLEAGTYSAEGADDDDAVAAQAASSQIRAASSAMSSRVSRLRRWLDPRSLVQIWRRDHRARQRRITMTAHGDLEKERELVGSGDRG